MGKIKDLQIETLDPDLPVPEFVESDLYEATRDDCEANALLDDECWEVSDSLPSVGVPEDLDQDGDWLDETYPDRPVRVIREVLYYADNGELICRRVIRR